MYWMIYNVLNADLKTMDYNLLNLQNHLSHLTAKLAIQWVGGKLRHIIFGDINVELIPDFNIELIPDICLSSKVRINCILTSPFEYMCVRLNLHNKGTFFHWATFLHPVTLDDFSQWRGLFNGKPAHCCCFQKLEVFTGRHFSTKLLIENFKCALIRRQNNENLALWYLTACSLTPTYLTPCNLAGLESDFSPCQWEEWSWNCFVES